MHVLVTGADGFIGRALCPALEAADHTIRRSIQYANPAGVVHGDTIVVGDIDAETDWTAALTGVDVVIHLAGRAHVLREDAVDPLAEFRRVNVAATQRLAEMAANCTKRFILISSIGVSGNSTPRDVPLDEDSPVRPYNAYALSKWEAEQALHRIADNTGLDIVIVRPPLVYGPSVPANFLRLIKIVATGWPLPLSNTHNQRSFVSRTNLVDFLLHCVEHPGAAGETFLISDGEDVSTTELIRKIAYQLELPARLFPFPELLINLLGRMFGGEHVITQIWGSLVVDSHKARRLLDWEPPITMDEELVQTVKWFKGNSQSPC